MDREVAGTIADQAAERPVDAPATGGNGSSAKEAEKLSA